MLNPFKQRSTDRYLVNKNFKNIYLRKQNHINQQFQNQVKNYPPSFFTFQAPNFNIQNKRQNSKSFKENLSLQKSLKSKSYQDKYKSMPKFILNDIMNREWRNNLQNQQRRLLKVGGPQTLRQTPSFYKQIKNNFNDDYYDQKKKQNKKPSILIQPTSQTSNLLLDSAQSFRQKKSTNLHQNNHCAQKYQNLQIKRQSSRQSTLSKRSILRNNSSGHIKQKKKQSKIDSKIRFSQIDQDTFNTGKFFKIRGSTRQSDIGLDLNMKSNLILSSSDEFIQNMKSSFPGIIGMKGMTFKRVF